MTTAIWAGRLEGKADDLFREFNDSLPFDRALVREDIEGSVAWSKAIMRAGVITAEEAMAIASDMDQNKDGVFSIAELAQWAETNTIVKLAEDGREKDLDDMITERVANLNERNKLEQQQQQQK